MRQDGKQDRLTIGEGLSLAGWGGRHVGDSRGAIGGAHGCLPHFFAVGLHHKVALVVGANAHSVSHTKPVNLNSPAAFSK